MQDKLLTIIVPTYNIEKYITKCIESFKEVNKDYYNEFEVIVVNDGSTDNSEKVISDLMLDSNLDLRVQKKMGGTALLSIEELRKQRANILKLLMEMIG